MKKKRIFVIVFFCILCTESFLFAQTWYPFQGPSLDSASILNAASCLDAPAGKHGWLLMEGNDYCFADGTPVKFWGVNICNMGAFPQKELADRWCFYLVR